jgi:hypothetical protein
VGPFCQSVLVSAYDVVGSSATRVGRWLGRAVRVAFGLALLAGLLGAVLTAARREPLTALRDDFGAGRVAEVDFSDGTAPRTLQLHSVDREPAVRWKVVGSGWRSASLAAGPADILDPDRAGFGTTGAGPGTDDGADPGTGDTGGTDGTDPGTDGTGGTYYGTGPGTESEAGGPDAAAAGQDDTQTAVRQAIQRRAQALGVPVSTGSPRTPRLLAGLAQLAAVLLVLVLIGAPQPRRATKWAWFWLMLVPGGLTQLAWLAVEAPWSERANRRPEPRPHGDQPADARLTGGRSFLLSGILGLVLGWIGWQVGGWLAR